MLLLVALIVYSARDSAVAPFIYTLF